MENTAKYKVFENQSWLDISNVLYGSSAYACQLAQLNGTSVTQEIKAGEEIHYSTDLQNNKLVLLSMASYKSIPATVITQRSEDIITLEGIDYWAVGVDFKVS